MIRVVSRPTTQPPVANVLALLRTAIGPMPPRGLMDLPCWSHDPDLWFAGAPAELERAKRLCADCPVRRACLAGAISRREPWGVWGGEIFDQGHIIPRKRPRGRPRKAEAA